MANDDEAAGNLPTGSRLTALDEVFRKDPYAVLSRLRSRDPVHRDEELKRWFITDHDMVKEVLRARDFCVDARKAVENSFARQIAGSGEDAEAPSMLGLDDPDHRRLRSFVSRAFAPKAVEALRPKVAQVVDEVLGRLRARASFDVIGEYASPVPFQVLAGMLGVEASDQVRFRQWAESKVQAFDPFRSEETAAGMKRADTELRDYFRHAIAERRTSARKNDILSDLVQANERGETLSEDEIVTMCNLLIVAGIVTTTDLIGNGVLALLRHPEQCRKLRQQPDLIVGAVEEMLRFDSPVIQTGRIATREVSIGGRCIGRGESLSLSLGAANHDPRVFSHPQRFDIERKDNHHHSFGGGVHLCLGAALARLQAQVAINRLLQAFPSLRLAGEPVRRRLPVLHGCEKLVVLAL